MADDARAKAESMWQEVMRFDAPPITDPYTEATTDTVFGGVWARPGLARRDRRLTSMTVIATRGFKEPLVAHLSAALSSGDLSADELHEWVLHLSFYAGWPVGATAYAALREVLAHPTASTG
jgi:4-carboxymuconolactone decarboxylase